MRLLEGGVHHVLREPEQLGAAADEGAQRRRVPRVVLGLHLDVRVGAGRLEDGLVFRRQRVVGLLVDEAVELGAALPPAGVVVVRRDLVEAELQVVVGADPLGGVDRSLLERLIDLAAGNVLRHAAHALDHLAGEAADAELEALDVGDRLDLLAVPAAHLRAGVAGREVDDVVGLVELAHQLHAVAVVHPRRLSGANSGRTESRSRARTHRPCRRSSTAPCARSRPSRSAPRRRRRRPASARPPRASRSGTCRRSSRRPSWRSPRRRRRACRASAESSTPVASARWPGH